MAVGRQYSKDKEQETDFINFVAWRHTAEFIARNVTKGQPMLVEGRLQQRQYQDKADKTQYVFEVIVDNAYFAGFKRDNAQTGNPGYGDEFDPYADAA